MSSPSDTQPAHPRRRRGSPFSFERHDDLLDAVIPGGERDHWPISSVLDLLPGLPNWPLPANDSGRRSRFTRGSSTILEWLASHPGDGWQQRWINSGADISTEWIDTLAAASSPGAAAARDELIMGLGSLLLCRVFFPSYDFLAAYKAKALYTHARRAFRPDLFDRLEARSGELRISPAALRRAELAISKIVLHTGRDVDRLSADDILAFRTWMLRDPDRRKYSPLDTAWQLLSGIAELGDHATLKDAIRHGQRPTAELVDAYQIRCRPVRDMLIRYLDERRPALDYGSFTGLVGTLAGRFWADIEHHHPGIQTLDLPEAAATAWRDRLKTVVGHDGSSRPRKNHHDVLRDVRALYRDLQEWAAGDPASWAEWSFSSPVRKSDIAGQAKAKRKTTAAMHQRIRERLPHLPALIDTAERHKAAMTALHAAASAIRTGEMFVHGGRQYRRIVPKSYTDDTYYRDAAPPLLIEDTTTGEVVDLGQAEHDAFWAWAVVEVLRHTGVRIEEMLEITHLGLVSYRLPDTGEIVPMLQIVPSKSNEERLLLVSPELASVLAVVITRLRRHNDGAVPLTSRYDPTEHLVGPPLPHLFQHTRNGWTWEVPAQTTIYKLLDQTVARAGLTTADGHPLRYRPHDFRRMFATEAAAGGLPVHILARILGHANINTTQAYMAVFDEALVRTYRAFLDRRRAARPEAEYREPTPEEWAEFQAHFHTRKLELGECGRPYGTPCKHEHACIRCPSLRLDPSARPRLVAIIANLRDRVQEAQLNGWLGEVAGLQVSLNEAARKLTSLDRARARGPAGPVDLGVPVIADSPR
ncbi:tyrosine-type recombinase/integrase [Amycolatopsis sp. NBC_00438]|uniref:tyrosine-type recombinase/integrase n=1 Tax=Amycolatopsis sp. NBC_00438 TaxID=2903558 RepID=UPI002E2226C3